jgi:hypothetical protein
MGSHDFQYFSRARSTLSLSRFLSSLTTQIWLRLSKKLSRRSKRSAMRRSVFNFRLASLLRLRRKAMRSHCFGGA